VSGVHKCPNLVVQLQKGDLACDSDGCMLIASTFLSTGHGSAISLSLLVIVTLGHRYHLELLIIAPVQKQSTAAW